MSALSEIAAATRRAHDRAAPGTVSIGRDPRGTGIVVGANRVLTSAHNLRDRTTEVGFADGTRHQGAVVGVDADHDVVVLDVPTGDVAALPWRDDPLGPGDAVFAVGRGRGGTRVTPGFVSGVDRTFRGPRGRRVQGAVEHTAPLARGSSGGPLVDGDGRLAGINTHRLGDGFYLALPTDTDLRGRVDALLEGRSPRSRVLGVVIVPGPKAARARRRVGLPDLDGLLVHDVVPGTPAAAAGIAEGDLITAVGGATVATVDQLWDALDAAGAGVQDRGDDLTIEVTLVRGTDERVVAVRLDAETDAP
ncbi:MAG: serine protease [Acidimicrobiales bacterium]|nr:serine protease [Acidimicrobiales bacterium]